MTTPSNTPLVAVTAGEPAGIGPDLCAMISDHTFPARIVVIADETLLHTRARKLGFTGAPPRFNSRDSAPAFSVLHVPLKKQAVAGRLDPANSRYVLRTLEIATDGCRDGIFDAMATAPVHKGVINDAGIPFTGHTEFLQERLLAPHVVMMLAGGGMRVALATTHLPLHQVAAAITGESLERTLRVLRGDLVQRFAIAQPRIIVAGLNPHAGEGGLLGTEDDALIQPAVERLRAEGHDVSGPWPGDTVFHRHLQGEFDAVAAIYHDQGLAPLKTVDFATSANLSLGLKHVRTSPDHGTAYELAGTGRADRGSFDSAVRLARLLSA